MSSELARTNMKNKASLLIVIGLATTLLTACSYFPFFKNNNGEYSYQDVNSGKSNNSSDENSSQDASSWNGNSSTAYAPSYKYSDVVKNSVYSLSCTPSTGDVNLLVIPVWFTDSSTFIKDNSKKETVRSDIEKTYFGKNTDTMWRSVKTYYEEESHQNLSLSGKVSNWYECGKSYKYYAQDPASKDSGAPKTAALVKDAVDWYFNNNSGESRLNYDADGDGYLDGVMLIYAAPDYASLQNDDYTNLWAFCFWIQEAKEQNPNKPGVNAFFWASYDYMYGSEVAFTKTGSVYHGGDTAHCNLDAHSYIHEMGHMFGLEDYYDYSNNSYQPAAAFSMQDHNVGGHDPFSVYALGWGKAYIPNESITINLKPFTSSGEMILLTPNWNGYNSPFDEYFLLEYYTADGLNTFDTTYRYMADSRKRYPEGSKASGIRLWHVDARLLYTATGLFSEKQITTIPDLTINGVHQRVVAMMSNTYYDGSSYSESYCSVLGTQYADYNLLQLIRNNRMADYQPSDFLSESSLFTKGDSFSMNSYARQFVNYGKLNSKKELGFTFKVNSCDDSSASISIEKA